MRRNLVLFIRQHVSCRQSKGSNFSRPRLHYQSYLLSRKQKLKKKFVRVGFDF